MRLLVLLGSATDTATIAATLGQIDASVSTAVVDLATIAATLGRVSASVATSIADHAMIAATLGQVEPGVTTAIVDQATVAATLSQILASATYQSAQSPQTDQVAFDAIVTLLQATSAFQTVRHGSQDEILSPSADDAPRVTIVPISTTDAPLCDDGTYLRTVTYKTVISVRDQDPQARRATLGLLEATARNALLHQGLGGFCFPAMTQVGSAQWPKPRHPDQRIEIASSFVYLIESPSTHDTTDTYQR